MTRNPYRRLCYPTENTAPIRFQRGPIPLIYRKESGINRQTENTELEDDRDPLSHDLALTASASPITLY